MKPIVTVLVIAFAGLTLLMTLYMPAAELMTAWVHPAAPQNGQSFFRPEFLMDAFKGLGNQLASMLGQGDLDTAVKNNPNLPYYIYSLFLGLALTTAAIAINAIGRWDAEEKTVIPLKK